MKKNGLIFLLITLWLLTSTREFYLHYSIQKIKQQQQRHITHLKETEVLKTLITSPNDPFIEFEGKNELYYRDTLYDIVSAENITPSKIKYILLSDIHEQNLWAFLFENHKPINQEDYVITFYYKFIALQSDDFYSFNTSDIIYFSTIPTLIKPFLVKGFAERLLQPPD